jgi:polysaccharide pyruvyl transferase WcaK-like protein
MRGQPPEIAVFGEWNTHNLGDRAIHESVVRFCAECGWEPVSYAIGSLTPVVRGRANGAGAPARWRAALDAAPRLKRVLREVRQRARMRELLGPLDRMRAIIVGGGALLSDWNLHFPQSLAVLADAARRLGKPVFCLGCGAEGPWSAPAERKIRTFLDACTFVAARDEATAARVAQLLGRPIPVFGDFCLGTEAPAARNGARTPRSVYAINVQQLAAPWAAMQEGYEAAVVALADRMSSETAADRTPEIRIFTTGTAEDVAPARRVFARISAGGGDLAAALVLPGKLDELFDLLDASSFVVASRLHAGILAVARGAAVVGFSPQPKLRECFSTLGIGGYGFDLDAADRIVRSMGEPGAIAAWQRECVSQAPVWACRMQVREKLETLAGGASACR